MAFLRSAAVPATTFVLAVLLSMMAGPGGLHARRLTQQTTGQPCCEVCVHVIVLGPTDKGPNKGKGGSKYSALTAADRQAIQARVQVAKDLWAKCCITLNFDPQTDIEMVPATPDMVGDDGNLVGGFTVPGEFFKEYFARINPKCVNLLLIKNGQTGTVKTNEMNVDAPSRNGNLSTLPDDALTEAERGGTSTGHEMGHQVRLGDINRNDERPDPEKFLMWFNASRTLPSQGGGVIPPEDCQTAYARVCDAGKNGFAPERMIPWLIDALREAGNEKLAKDLEKLQKSLEKGKPPK